MVTPEQVLLRASELMRERGQCKDAHSDTDGHYCMGATLDDAYHQAGEEHGWFGPSHSVAENLMLLVTGRPTLRHFNDQPDVGPEECAKAFELGASIAAEFWQSAQR